MKYELPEQDCRVAYYYWCKYGFDTFSIAEIIGVHESIVYNSLSRFKDQIKGQKA